MGANNNFVLLLIFAAVVVSIGTIFALVLLSRLKQEIMVMRRMNKISSKQDTSEVLQAAQVSNLIRGKKNQNLDSIIGKYLPTLEGMRSRFRQAGMRMSLGIYILAVLVGAAMLTYKIGPPLSRVPYVELPMYVTSIAAAFIVHTFLNKGVLGFLINRRQNKIIEQMPLALDFLVRSLVVGQPIDAALREAVKEIEPPFKDELETLVGQLSIGAPLEKALRSTAADVQLKEYDFFAIATIVQIESGGNLGEALRGLSETIRQRHAMRMKVQALASEGKASAIVLSALPVLLLMYFKWMSPEYVEPLFSDPRGNLILLGASFFIFVGALIMRKMVRIKI